MNRLAILESRSPTSGLPGASREEPLLEVQGIGVRFRQHRAVDDVSFSIRRGRTTALVGESGSGKSTIGLAIMGLLPSDRSIETSGSILLHDGPRHVRDLLTLSAEERRQIRGKEIAMIFQDPMSSLNPIYSIKSQLCEAILLHQKLSKPEAHTEAYDSLLALGIPNPENCLESYPHQLSGGMRQRVMIAMALASRPNLLIADEPTTALDATIQAQILDLLQNLQAQTGMAILFITHNIGIVSEMADDVMVMYDGQLVENGAVSSVFRAPRMPYTRALLRAVPRIGRRRRPGELLEAIPGQVPGPDEPRHGCSFFPRCSYSRQGLCDTARPPFEEIAGNHWVRCLRWTSLEEAAP